MEAVNRSAAIAASLLAAFVALLGQGAAASAVRDSRAGCPGYQLTSSQSVQAAINARAAGSTFCLKAGVYRVAQPIAPKAGDRFIGATGTVISGGKAVTSWAHVGHEWVARGESRVPTLRPGGGYGGSYEYPIAVYGDDLYMDSAALQKVGVRNQGRTIGSSKVGPGQYFVDYDKGEILLGSNPFGHNVELATSSAGIQAHVPDVSISGVTVEMTTGAGIATSASGWTLDGDQVRFVHGAGIQIGSNADLSNDNSHDNGTYGIIGSGANIVVQQSVFDHNNTARYYHGGDKQCYDAGGTKFTFTTGLDFEHNTVLNNLCPGIWLDIDNANSRIISNYVEGNFRNGIDDEISYTAKICGNDVETNAGYGILIAASSSDTVCDNTVANNGNGGIWLNQLARNEWPSPLGPHLVVNTEVTGNTVNQPHGLDGAHEAGVIGTPFAGAVFSSSNLWNNNHYVISAAGSQAFAWEGKTLNWTEWRATGHDLSS